MSAVVRGPSIGFLMLCSLLVCVATLQADDGIEVRKALLKATARAIELEIESYEGRLKAAEAGTGPRDNVERFRRRLGELEAERAAYARLKPEDYPEPVRQDAGSAPILELSEGSGPVRPPIYREVRITVDETCRDGTLLSVDGASKSGPFYHLAGIAGGDYRVLERGKRYRVTLCLVYRREYFGLIGDYYVYAAEAR